jgi:hypothetical protein
MRKWLKHWSISQRRLDCLLSVLCDRDADIQLFRFDHREILGETF